MIEDLSRRQRQCLELAAGGLTRKQVAHRLGIGHNTVRTHLGAALRTLGAANIGQAILALERAEHQAERDAIRAETTAQRLYLRAFDAFLAGKPGGALALRAAADELAARHGYASPHRSGRDEVLERILGRVLDRQDLGLVSR